MTILGLSCFYHDSAACILKDGQIVAAAAEERFTRKKHDNGFPKKAIEFCLDSLGIAINEVNTVAFYEKPIVKFERILSQHLEHFPQSRKTFVNSIGSWLSEKLQIQKILRDEFHYQGKVLFLPHHLSHAAASYYLSGFNKAVIVTIDGVGEWTTTTIGTGRGGKIKIDREVHFPHSLGLFYSALTAYLGFKVNNDEYKVMGLAAYGNPKPFRPQMDKLIKTFPDGSFSLDTKFFDYTWADHMPSKAMEKLFGYPTRQPESKAYQYHKNIAAALQEKLEKTVFHLLNVTYRKYKIENLCLSGGVALNSVMNGKILKNTPFKRIFIPPDPGDAGGAMGAALLMCHSEPDGKSGEESHSEFRTRRGSFDRSLDLRMTEQFSPYLGPGYTRSEIQKVLQKHQLKYTWHQDEKKLLDKVANLIIKQKIIGWFQGRMEWGPRALGNRSILASAAKPEMKDIINAKVKHREMFRPFAPVIAEEDVYRYFEADKELSPSANYMLMVYPFREKVKKEVPAVVHVDGTGRLQVISRQDNPLFYDLIRLYGQKTGTPIIVNTSFNVRGEPIVCTPEEAVKCFLGTGIDYLVIDRFLVKKK